MAIDKKVYIIGNKVTFNMEVTKDKSGKITSPTHVIRVTVDTTGMTVKDATEFMFSGSSWRVRLQNTKLRPLSESKLKELAETGFSCQWSIITESTPKDLILLLSKDEFIELFTEEYGVDKEQAERMYCNKHGLEYKPAPKNVSGINPK